MPKKQHLLLLIVFSIKLLVGCGVKPSSGGVQAGSSSNTQQVSASQTFSILPEGEIEFETEQRVVEGENQSFGLAFSKVQKIDEYFSTISVYLYLDGDNSVGGAESPILLLTHRDALTLKDVSEQPRLFSVVDGSNQKVWKIENLRVKNFGMMLFNTAIISKNQDISDLNLETDIIKWVSDQASNSIWETADPSQNSTDGFLCFWLADGKIVSNNQFNPSVDLPAPELFIHLFEEKDVVSFNKNNSFEEGVIAFSNLRNISNNSSKVMVEMSVKFGLFDGIENFLKDGEQPSFILSTENQYFGSLLLYDTSSKYMKSREVVLPVNEQCFITVLNDGSHLDNTAKFFPNQENDSAFRENLPGGNTGLAFYIKEVNGEYQIHLGKIGE